MKYLEFFNLEIVHDYYINQRCPDFQIEPTDETKKLLRDCRCILKFFLNGVRLLIQVTEGTPQKPFIPPPAGAEFCFWLRLKNPDFCLFTDSAGFARLYRNTEIMPTPIEPLEPVHNPPKLRLKPGVFAEIKIKYDNLMEMGKDAPTFQVRFNSLQAIWKYYIVSEKADKLTVEDEDKNNVIHFIKSEGTPDPIADELTRQYPKMPILCFVSENSVSCQQAARTAIQLKREGETLIHALPNPPLQNYVIDPGYSLYQIITNFVH